MFCYQCEQTAKGTGCTVQGVCGKLPDVTALQDLLLYCLMGLSQVAVEERKVGISDSDINVFTVKAGFSIAKCARYLYKKFRYKTHFHS